MDNNRHHTPVITARICRCPIGWYCGRLKRWSKSAGITSTCSLSGRMPHDNNFNRPDFRQCQLWGLRPGTIQGAIPNNIHMIIGLYFRQVAEATTTPCSRPNCTRIGTVYCITDNFIRITGIPIATISITLSIMCLKKISMLFHRQLKLPILLFLSDRTQPCEFLQPSTAEHFASPVEAR